MSKLTVENLKVLDETAANSCESAEHLIKVIFCKFGNALFNFFTFQ